MKRACECSFFGTNRLPGKLEGHTGLVRPMRVLNRSVLALAMPIVHADEGAKHEATRLGEHPAVIVGRRGVPIDRTSKFYLHPARLSWSTQRPLARMAPILSSRSL